jgi:hypothetical protein
MVFRIHRAEQHRATVPGIELMTLVSNHHFPRHSHDQFSIGVMAFGAQRSWSGVGLVSASAGDVIMANPGEMHDGVPLDSNPRRWRMIYIDPVLLAREVEEETVGQSRSCIPLHATRFWPDTSPSCLLASQPHSQIAWLERRTCFAP